MLVMTEAMLVMTGDDDAFRAGRETPLPHTPTHLLGAYIFGAFGASILRVDSRALSAPPCRPLFANRRFALAITRRLRWAWHNNTNTSVIYFIAFISRKVNYRRNEPLNEINFAASSDRVTSSKFIFQLCNGPFAVISHFVL